MVAPAIVAASILGGSSLLSGQGQKKGAKKQVAGQRAAEAARMAAADPARLQAILFGSPAQTTTGLTPQQIGGLPGGVVSRLAGGVPQNRPAQPGLVSQFREGLQPMLTSSLEELGRAGQTLQSGVATGLARRGLTGTGIGMSLGSAAAAVPVVQGQEARQQFDTLAFQQALNSAITLMGAQAGVPVGAQPFIPTGAGVLGQAGGDIGTTLALKNLMGGGGNAPNFDQAIANLPPRGTGVFT